MFENLENLGVDAQEKNAVIVNFMRIFKEKNAEINLMSRNDADFLFEKHIYDSLAFNLFRRKYLKNRGVSLLDIGSGGGFPSVPIAVYFDDIEVTAAESIGKKIKFIEYAAQTLMLKNLHTACGRIEEMHFSEKFDAASSRAVSKIRTMLEYAVPYLKIGGFLVLYKSVKAEEEIKEARNALKILNSEIIDRIDYKLPLQEEYKRELIIVRKNAETPDIYPRRNGLPVKKPL